MSHFTVTINQVLDRMKTTSGTTRQQVADRIGMSLSTLSSYTTERTKPTAESLTQICSGVAEEDASRIIIAHLTDETPEAWRGRLAVQLASPGTVTLAEANDLPPKFQRQLKAIIGEASSNKHIIGFIDEFATLLGLEALPARPRSPLEEVLCPPPEKLRAQPVPEIAQTARGPKRGSSISSFNEDSPDAKKPGPRARTTRGIKNVVKKDSSK